jgi:Ca2+-dependent lipid-binding protein
MKGAGKFPTWNNTFEIQIGSTSDEIQFFLKDNDLIGATQIGSTILKASSLCINNGVKDWFSFTFEGKEAARVFLETSFKPKGGIQQAATMMASIPVVPVIPVMATTVP